MHIEKRVELPEDSPFGLGEMAPTKLSTTRLIELRHQHHPVQSWS